MTDKFTPTTPWDGGTTTTSFAQQGPITVDNIYRMMAALPKPDVFLSSRLFPSDQAIHVEGGAEKFTCAHPDFWRLAISEMQRRSSDSPTVNVLLGLTGIRVIDIDAWPGESADAAKWRASQWTKLREAFEVAMTPIPEWLRSAPSFGRHG